MNLPQDEVFERLETAVDTWQKQIAGSHVAFSGHIDRIRTSLRNFSGSDSQDKINQRISALEATIAEFRKENAALKSQQLKQDSEECLMLRRQVEELKSAVEQERLRFEELEKQAPPHDEAAVDSLADRLASAIHDRDEAHQEIVSLRAEVAMLRRANAVLAVPESNASGDRAVIEVIDADGRRLLTGEILIRMGLLTEPQLDAALNEQKHAPHWRLGAILIEQEILTETVVAQVLARQLDLPFLRLTQEVVDEAAPRMITEQLARQRTCIPIAVSPERIAVAMANPFDLIAMDEIEAATGRRVDPSVATPTAISAALNRYYGNT